MSSDVPCARLVLAIGFPIALGWHRSVSAQSRTSQWWSRLFFLLSNQAGVELCCAVCCSQALQNGDVGNREHSAAYGAVCKKGLHSEPVFSA